MAPPHEGRASGGVLLLLLLEPACGLLCNGAGMIAVAEKLDRPVLGVVGDPAIIFFCCGVHEFGEDLEISAAVLIDFERHDTLPISLVCFFYPRPPSLPGGWGVLDPGHLPFVYSKAYASFFPPESAITLFSPQKIGVLDLNTSLLWYYPERLFFFPAAFGCSYELPGQGIDR
jgi:hypothetical protein